MCHIFGGMTPDVIWSMTYRDFRSLAAFADSWVKAQNTKE